MSREISGSVDVTGTITVDQINEFTGSNGVGIENLNITDFDMDTDSDNNLTISRNGTLKLTIAGAQMIMNDIAISNVRSAGTNIGYTSGITTDTISRFQIDANGEVEWGAGGVSAVDVALRRRAAGVLNIDDTAGGSATLEVDNLDADNAGTLTIGPAIATKVEIADTGVETEIQGTLDVQEAASFSAQAASVRASSGLVAFQGRISGDSDQRWQVLSDGEHRWGSGSATPDVSLSRQATNTLLMNDNAAGDSAVFNLTGRYQVSRTAASAAILNTFAIGDAQNRHIVAANGAMQWGDGTSSTDLRVQRRTANVLNIDDTAGGSATLEVDNLDADNAGTLTIGPAIATKVEIADTGVTTEIQGPLTTLTTFNGLNHVNDTVQTTDATVTTLTTISTTTDRTYNVDILVVGRRSDSGSESASYNIKVCYRNNSGTLTQVGGDELLAFEDTAAWNATSAISGTNILIRVTGEVAKTIEWKSGGRYLESD